MSQCSLEMFLLYNFIFDKYYINKSHLSVFLILLVFLVKDILMTTTLPTATVMSTHQMGLCHMNNSIIWLNLDLQSAETLRIRSYLIIFKFPLIQTFKFKCHLVSKMYSLLITSHLILVQHIFVQCKHKNNACTVYADLSNFTSYLLL